MPLANYSIQSEPPAVQAQMRQRSADTCSEPTFGSLPNTCIVQCRGLRYSSSFTAFSNFSLCSKPITLL
jgi:hypothetical protein